MFASARKAAALIGDPAFFWLVLKALGLTILLFAVLFVGLEYGIHRVPVRHTALVDAILPILSSALMFLLVMFLGAPVAALFASLFLEEIARSVERKFYPDDPPAGRAPFWRGLLLGLRLFLLLMVFQLLLLPLNLLAGLGALLSLLVNGWFLGRGYFELVALRHLPANAVDDLRRRRASSITGAGLVIALLATIPLVNLAAPLFGVALMVHEFKRYTHEELRA
jgi:CysZ protein